MSTTAIFNKYKFFMIYMLAVLFWGGPYVFSARAAGDWTVHVERTVGNKQTDRGFFAQPTSDGGYIIVGETQTGSDYDLYLVKLSAKGYFQWHKTFGGVKNDRGYSVRQTSDGGYIIAGTTQPVSGRGDYDVYLVKTGASGRQQWHREFGGTGEDTGTCVLQTTDGGYIIAGTTNSSGAGASDAYLIKTDAAGKKEWEKTFGGKETDSATVVRQTSDGGYIVAGQTYSSGAGGYDVYLVKTDVLGNLIWTQTFGGVNWDTAASVEQTSDGGYIVVGQTAASGAGNNDIYLIRINSDGEKIWEKTFGGADFDTGKSVQQTKDGGFLVAGWSNSFGKNGYELYLVETDASGKKLWDKTWASDKFDPDFAIVPHDKGYIVTGWWAERLGNNQSHNDELEVYLVDFKFE